MEQYMKIILKNAKEQGQLKELLNQQISLVGIRISLVTACMVSEKKAESWVMDGKKTVCCMRMKI